MFGFIGKLFGDSNEKELKKIQPYVEKINVLEPQMQAMSDTALAGKTIEFKTRIANGETQDNLLPEAFAVVREASKRILGMRHFDVQLIGGVALHQGKIAEMRTGEGKTLVATLPVYLNALTEKGVHVVTVNEYLAKRDSEWMGQVYQFLGLSVGLIGHGLDFPERKAAYLCDVTYGTNSEFGFDFLRDNMVVEPEQMVQRGLNYSIVDEVDSILIDEARTPLIISGPGEKSTDLYKTLARITPSLVEGEDYTIDEKNHAVAPTEQGIAKAERMLGVKNLYEGENVELSHHFTQALKAKALMKVDRDYVVKDGEVIIVDEFTGRLMFGRRFSDGLHQAIEAKEGVRVERESQTLATITFQNYFRMYKKLAGMTGTAKTEENEFKKIYNLDVLVVPTNMPNKREDLADVIYKTKKAKYKAVVNEIVQRHATGQPILVGTTSIVQSEELSKALGKSGVKHNVLNAKYHEKEAEIISMAGQKSAVTIATNMAGRGTDIVLGEEVPELGGLHIIGTERHESRRIDNQLRGRSGRQGDLGSSRFYLSLEDDLMRLFGSDNIYTIMDKLGMEEDEPIEHTLITRSIESAQKKVENRNFEIRKQVLDYDNVMNQQREVIYAQRKKILLEENLSSYIKDMILRSVNTTMTMYAPKEVYPEDWDLQKIIAHAEEFYAPANILDEKHLSSLSRDELQEYLEQIALDHYQQRQDELGDEMMRSLEKIVMLRVVDDKWMEHLDAMDMLREGIGLRAYGQKDPLIEYKVEAYDMFQAMTDSIQDDVVRYIYRINIISQIKVEDHLKDAQAVYSDDQEEVVKKKQPVVNKDEIGRNEPCPCGSGKKYKQCCGRN